jgi:glycosyltransferase involved in cell wall biosynthesis
MKILLASEEITNRPREGTLVFLMHLCRFLHGEEELTVIHAVGELDPDIRTIRALSRKTLVTRDLLRLARRERFDAVLYVPLSGLTAFGVARGALLRLVTGSPVIAIGLQERSIGRAHAFLSAFGKPDLVLSPAASVRERLERIGIETDFIMPGYDNRLFSPAGPELRAQLKAKYDFPRDRYIVLHVGHVKESRNLEVLLR